MSEARDPWADRAHRAVIAYAADEAHALERDRLIVRIAELEAALATVTAERDAAKPTKEKR